MVTDLANRKLRLADQINTDKIIVLGADSDNSFDEVLHLRAEWEKVKKKNNKALKISFGGPTASKTTMGESFGKLTEVNLKDAIARKNSPSLSDSDENSIYITSEKDYAKIARALSAYEILKINSAQGELSISNFTTGRQIIIPDIQDRYYVLDANITKIYNDMEFYWGIVENRLKTAYLLLDNLENSFVYP